MNPIQEPTHISAPSVSDIFPSLELMTKQIQAISEEHSVSQVLIYSYIKDWATRRLQSEVDLCR